MTNEARDEKMGKTDCDAGITAREGMSDSYYEGYGIQFECDAIHAHTMENFNEMWAAV